MFGTFGTVKRNAVGVGATILLAIAMVMAVGLSTASAQSGADDPGQVEAGMAVYESNCAGCHGAEGEGSDRGRPLTGIASQGDRATHIASVTSGKGNMPAFGERLSDDEIGSAVSFVRLTFVAQDEPAELAVTGYNSTFLALIGALLAVGGGGLLALSQRRKFAD